MIVADAVAPARGDRAPTPVPAAGDADRVDIRTVGIDVGSATFHLAFSRVHLERRAQELSTRFDVVHRETLWSSPISLTPYRDEGDTIDVAAVHDTVCRSYEQAGLTGADIDSGAVLLTGTALARHNARALAERLAGDSGRFVCAAAGHHLEAVLAAHGSGAVDRSATEGGPVVNVDLGGGTTKLALVVDGEVQATAALAVGSRLVAWDTRGQLTRVESSVVPLCRALGIAVGPGLAVPGPAIDELCDHLARAVVRQLGARRVTRRAVTDPNVDLLLTEPFPRLPSPSAIVLSGGVAEYIDQPQGGAGEGDLGPFLARALVAQLRAGGLGDRLRPARERIRATVIGASQFSTQVSGSTIRIGDGAALPIHNVPVVRVRVAPHETVEPATVAAAVRRAIAARADELHDRRAIAVAIAWQGPPAYRRLHAVADGVRSGMRAARLAPEVVVLTVDRDLAASLGRIMVDELGVDRSSLICLDHIDVGALDFLDIGCPSPPAHVVPVVIKSLLFDPGRQVTAAAEPTGPFPSPGDSPQEPGT